MKYFFNKAVKQYLRFRYRRITLVKNRPIDLQKQVLKNLLEKGESTEYGNLYQLSNLMTAEAFSNNVPIVKYEDIYTYIERMMNGEKNILWPSQIKSYAKSSGTTNDRSKYIPMSKEIHYKNHVASSWDTMSIVYNEDPRCKIFQEKSLIMGGATEDFNGVEIGDVSAILLNKMHWAGRPFFTPDFSIATHPDWEEKIEKMAIQCTNENVVMLGGVPTWTLLLCHKILEITGMKDILEVWPNLKYYMHGGVGMNPYYKQFEELFPSQNFKYFETYNASEGYFAISDYSKSEGMLLLLNNNIYYEFIKMSDFNYENRNAITLENVELGVNYAMVITTSAGLWRYIIGDTIMFTSLAPYRIIVTGRTKQYINVFGEEVMVTNTEKALKNVCDKLNVKVKDYTIAPVYINKGSKGGHKWYIEFIENPADLKAFELVLDNELRLINSDYDAKRMNDMAMANLKIEKLPRGSFDKWMKSRGKFGGQNKVPRLCNTNKYVDQLLKFI